ncbi:hypothetical protein D9B85_09865 [Corynebacterium diphtheriae]|nr:hypothetical protein B1A59_06130 [Corynebacterium diphtheriae]RKX00501.1 hypothetical protein D9B85_09865 [Corynebacterium diphtheriae]
MPCACTSGIFDCMPTRSPHVTLRFLAAPTDVLMAGGRWRARHPRSPPKKTAFHTKSAQTAGLEAIWCEVRRKILRNTPV